MSEKGKHYTFGPPKLMLFYNIAYRSQSYKSQTQNFSNDPMYVLAKTDVLQMIGILQLSTDLDGVAVTRVAELSKYI